MISDVLTWGAVIAAGTSIIAWIKFWVDAGKSQQKVEEAAEARRLLAAKIDLLEHNFNDYRVQVATTYATSNALNDVEKNLMAGVRDAVSGVYSRLDGLTTRLDHLTVSLVTKKEQ